MEYTSLQCRAIFKILGANTGMWNVCNWKCIYICVGAMMTGFEITSMILTSCQTYSIQHVSIFFGGGGGNSKTYPTMHVANNTKPRGEVSKLFLAESRNERALRPVIGKWATGDP